MENLRSSYAEKPKDGLAELGQAFCCCSGRWDRILDIRWVFNGLPPNVEQFGVSHIPHRVYHSARSSDLLFAFPQRHFRPFSSEARQMRRRQSYFTKKNKDGEGITKRNQLLIPYRSWKADDWARDRLDWVLFEKHAGPGIF